MRKFLADTLAMIAFSSFGAMVIELFIAGMTLNQSMQVRYSTIPILLFTARPYGIFRDWFCKKVIISEGGVMRRCAADAVAFMLFKGPIYILALIISGATFAQIAATCTSGAILLAFVGRPFGLLLDSVRLLLRAKA